jgi:hypothetical protein
MRAKQTSKLKTEHKRHQNHNQRLHSCSASHTQHTQSAPRCRRRRRCRTREVRRPRRSPDTRTRTADSPTRRQSPRRSIRPCCRRFDSTKKQVVVTSKVSASQAFRETYECDQCVGRFRRRARRFDGTMLVWHRDMTVKTKRSSDNPPIPQSEENVCRITVIVESVGWRLDRTPTRLSHQSSFATVERHATYRTSSSSVFVNLSSNKSKQKNNAPAMSRRRRRPTETLDAADRRRRRHWSPRSASE